METTQAVLDRHIAENRSADFNIRWDEASREIWARELEYVKKARKYLIDSHVFYKINYALVP